MPTISRSEVTRIFTGILVFLTTVQAVVPQMPITNPNTKAILEAIFMFLVVGFTAWKQYLSVEIRNAAIWPTIIIALIATLGGLNDLLNVIPMSDVTSQWVRLAVSTISVMLSLFSKTFWPTPESKVIEQTKAQMSGEPDNQDKPRNQFSSL